jgi:hypothetical protein
LDVPIDDCKDLFVKAISECQTCVWRTPEHIAESKLAEGSTAQIVKERS